VKFLYKLIKDDDGAVMVIVALALVVLLGCMALVVDAGVMYVTKSNMQNVADAAALAGAQAISQGGNPEALALEYAGKNGMKATVNGVTNDGDTVTVTTPYNGDSSKIFVKCTRNVPYLFAKALGFEDADVGAKAVARVTNPGGAAFDYAVFAGEGEAYFNGSQHVFGGSVYGRDGVSLGNKARVEGNVVCTTSGTINEGNGSNITGDVIDDHAPIPMPDFSELIKEQGIYTQSDIDDIVNNGKTVNGPIYVNGNITINGRIKGNGIIYASGTISFKDENILQDFQDSICFYAAQGDITFHGGNGVAIGIIYAPNGTVTVKGLGGESTIYGRVIAKEVDFRGGKHKIYANAKDLNSLQTLRSFALIE
jgi:Flp pilus assembly protein TadG/cytoskeletal protein CcmA (bactofilin family)